MLLTRNSYFVEWKKRNEKWILGYSGRLTHSDNLKKKNNIPVARMYMFIKKKLMCLLKLCTYLSLRLFSYLRICFVIPRYCLLLKSKTHYLITMRLREINNIWKKSIAPLFNIRKASELNKKEKLYHFHKLNPTIFEDIYRSKIITKISTCVYRKFNAYNEKIAQVLPVH